jgi:hypothetical protein
MSLDPLIASIIGAGALLAFGTWACRRLAPALGRWRRSAKRAEPLDTVAAWVPEPVRVLSLHEIEALELARRAAPGAMLLAQVPLSRFLRVPTRNSYGRWLARVGHLNADLLVCDARSRVLAVVDVRPPESNERSHRRHDRMLRVLRAAGITVLVWRQDRLPSIGAARAQFSALGVPADPGPRTASTPGESAPMPLEPKALLAALAEGDAAAAGLRPGDPVPSDFKVLPATPITLH